MENNCGDVNLDDSFDEDMLGESDFLEFDRLENESEHMFTLEKRMSCTAHGLMLVVQVAVEKSEHDIKVVQEKANALVASICKSPKAVELLKSKTNGLGLIKPCRTRWIFWFYVYERLLRIKNEICSVCEDLSILHNLGPADWKVLQGLRDLLSPFAAAVKALEGDKYVTITEVYPILFALKNKTEKIILRSGPINGVARALLEEMQRRFSKVYDITSPKFDPLYAVACFLVPKYCSMFEGGLLQAIITEISKLICFIKFADRSLCSENRYECSTEEVGDMDGSMEDVLSFFGAQAKKKRLAVEQSTPKKDETKLEISLYQKDADGTVDFDDLCNYWKSKKGIFPNLYLVTCALLPVPATSAPVERVFSKAVTILDKNRHNLGNTTLEKEILFTFNYESV